MQAPATIVLPPRPTGISGRILGWLVSVLVAPLVRLLADELEDWASGEGDDAPPAPEPVEHSYTPPSPAPEPDQPRRVRLPPLLRRRDR